MKYDASTIDRGCLNGRPVDLIAGIHIRRLPAMPKDDRGFAGQIWDNEVVITTHIAVSQICAPHEAPELRSAKLRHRAGAAWRQAHHAACPRSAPGGARNPSRMTSPPVVMRHHHPW